MLGWVMRRGGTAPDDFDDAGNDTTQMDAGSNTPAPVFAARAFKTAIFGSPTPGARAMRDEDTATLDLTARTPTKQPTGILMTPGTAASKRKKVSFNHDVVEKARLNNAIGKDPLVIRKNGRTPLFEAMERASKKRSPARMTESKKYDWEKVRTAAAGTSTTKLDMRRPVRTGTKAQVTTSTGLKVRPTYAAPGSGDEWEDDDDDTTSKNVGSGCNHDVTIDIADPKSQSGSYWKRMHESYRKDAQHEMVKCLKKCKSLHEFAQAQTQKAIEAEAARDTEKARAKDLERQVADLKAKLTTSRWQTFKTPITSMPNSYGDDDKEELMRRLQEKTDLATGYEKQIKQLEGMVKDQNSYGALSGRTSNDVLELRRELRQAKSQLLDMTNLRRELARVQEDLSSSGRRSALLENENKRLKNQISHSVGDTRLEAVQRQLRQAREELSNKDEELRRVKEEFERFRDETLDAQAKSNRVLERASEKLLQHQAEIRTLKRKSAPDMAIRREKSWEKPKGIPARDARSTTPPVMADETFDFQPDAWNAPQPTRPVESSEFIDEESQFLPASQNLPVSRNLPASRHVPASQKLPAPPSRPPGWSAHEKMVGNTSLDIDFNSDFGVTDKNSPIRMPPRETAGLSPPRLGNNSVLQSPERSSNWGLDSEALDLPEPLQSTTPMRTPYRSINHDFDSEDVFSMSETPIPMRNRSLDPPKPVAAFPRAQPLGQRLATRSSVPNLAPNMVPRRSIEEDSAVNSSLLTLEKTSRSTLPVDRKMAAMARIQERRAQKLQAAARLGKENVRP